MSLRSRFAGRASIAALLFGVVSTSTAVSAETVPAPTYQPRMTWSAANGTAGTVIKGFYVSTNTTYSTDITGPFGGSTTAMISQVGNAGKFWFGGNVSGTLNLTQGTDLWIRIYQYFPEDFCFSYGSAGDGWGATKWVRAQTTSGRSTVELGTAAPQSNSTYAFKAAPSCGTVTAVYGDINEMGAGNQPFPDYTAAPIVRGRWQALQVQWHFGDGDGYIRAWVDDTYLGQSNHTTLKSGATVQEIVYGDYWNGSFPANQRFYYDEIVITTQKPNTVDSGGRPFISPKTRIASFSGVVEPSPPTNLTVQ